MYISYTTKKAQKNMSSLKERVKRNIIIADSNKNDSYNNDSNNNDSLFVWFRTDYVVQHHIA